MTTILITALFTCPNVIIFSAINKTETKGRNKVTLINQTPTSEDENCGESEDGETQIETIVYVIQEINWNDHIKRMKRAGFVKPMGQFFEKNHTEVYLEKWM